jgi:hypothetical protein
MRSAHRRTATRVQDGRVQKKNNWVRDRGDYFAWSADEIRLDRRPPGPEGRHLVTIAQLRSFVELLPGWDDIAGGLGAIVLDSRQDCMGWCAGGVVAICAWERGLWWDDTYPSFAEEHRDLFALLDVECVTVDERLEVRWTEAQARAFQLLHILPHELGHHHDRITTRSRRSAARGEPYAESYANRVLDTVWPSYARQFGI